MFCYGDKRNDSLFSCNSIEKLYIDDFRIGDKHCIGNLKNLKDLTIANSNITSLSFAKELLQLKSLTILLIEDMDLTPIYNLEQLSMLDIPNRKCYPVKINCYWNWDDYGKIRKIWLTEK